MHLWLLCINKEFCVDYSHSTLMNIHLGSLRNCRQETQMREMISGSYNRNLCQPPSSSSDVILYWEHRHLDPQHESKKSHARTHAHSRPPSLGPWWVLFSHDAMPLFLTMSSSESLVHTSTVYPWPTPLYPTPPHPDSRLNSPPSIREAALHEYWKGLLSVQRVAVAGFETPSHSAGGAV